MPRFRYEVYEDGWIIERGDAETERELWNVYIRYGVDAPIRIWEEGRKLTYSESYSRIPKELKRDYYKFQVDLGRVKEWKLPLNI